MFLPQHPAHQCVQGDEDGCVGHACPVAVDDDSVEHVVGTIFDSHSAEEDADCLTGHIEEEGIHAKPQRQPHEPRLSGRATFGRLTLGSVDVKPTNKQALQGGCNATGEQDIGGTPHAFVEWQAELQKPARKSHNCATDQQP